MRRQWQAAALLDQRDELVELGAGMSSGERDAHGMEEVLALGAGGGFYFVHPGFELFGCDRCVRVFDALGKGERFLRALIEACAS